MPRLRTIILVLLDALVILFSYLLAFFLVRPSIFDPIELEEFFVFEPGWIPFLVISATFLFGMYFIGLYQQIRIQSRRRFAEDLLLVFGFNFLLQAVLSYSRGPYVISRWVMILGSVLAFVGLMLWRIVYSLLLVRLVGFQRVLFWGDTPVAREVAEHMAHYPEKGFETVGVVRFDAQTHAEGEFPVGQVLGIQPGLLGKVIALAPDRICVSGVISPEESLGEALLQCSMTGMAVETVGDLHEMLFQRVSLDSITINELIFSPSFRPARWKIVCQDIYSRFFSVAGILLTWPLMILTAIAVRLDSPGPALLRQPRVGINGEVFNILKFRSMFIDGDARFGTIRASDKDPRITRVGRVIRVTRLDELPQFFNVLRGDMTFVGPRPEMPVYAEKLTKGLPLYPQRLRVKPGITGWAQLHHVPELSLVETKMKVEYDLYYIKNMSPLFDFLIVFHTIRTLLYRTGAR